MFIFDDDDIVDDDTDVNDDDINDGDDDADDDAADDDKADAGDGDDDGDDDEDSEDGDDDGDDDDDASELVTVTYDGTDYEVPRGLEKAVMQEADYTQKSQALSTERTQFNEREAGAEASFAARVQQFDSAVAVAALDNELKGYEELNWQQLAADDQENGTNYVQQLQLEQQQLTKARETANTELGQKSEEAATANHERMVKAATATRTALKAKYPEWSPALEEKMAKFAIGLGVNEQTLRTTTNQATLDLLYKAYKFDQQEQKRNTAKRKGKKPKKSAAEPAAKIKGRRQGGRVNPDKLSPEKWRVWREKDLAKKAAAGG